MIALNAKNKMKLVTSAFPEPSMESELRLIWERNNDIVISWILNIVSKPISNNLNFINSVSKLWDELQEHYAQIDGHRIFQLTNEMVQLKQENCNKGYLNIRGQILLMQPLPSAAKAYTMVRQEEKQKETSNPKHQTSTILNSYTNQSRPSTSNSQKYNPPRPSTSSNNSDRRNITVPNTSYERITFRKGVYYGNCRKEGHYQEECYKVVGYPVGHPLHAVPQNPIPNNDGHVSERMDQLQNQINQVLLMLQNNQGSIGQGIFSSHSIKIPKFIATLITDLKDAWIIDSGVTDHVSITLTLMHDIHTLSTLILVSLPNAQTVEVTTYGSVTLNANITLHNLFHIPSFTYNIISVSKLLHGTSISLTLTASYCIFQDRNKRITHGTLCDGLYFISPTISSYTTLPTILHSSITPSLWHSRLGHSSFTVLRKIKPLASLFK
ncbi:hypothetical protein Tco_1374004 [Tanacetum coccineum]